jgi:undecaprenyl-diphosphatase
MSTLQAILLGLLQGVTEFLPISSTAHLRVVPALVGWNDPGAAFTAVTQLGTLAATLVYFRRDLARLAAGTLAGLKQGRPLQHPEARLGLGIVVGTLPIGVCGLLFRKAISTHLRSLQVIAAALIGLALVLWVAERYAQRTRDLTQVTFGDALLIGCAQALALVPGASRSGTTLTGGLLLGLRRETAARFSFLLSIPAVAAAGLFELRGVVSGGALSGEVLGPTLVATAAAFVSGLAAIGALMKLLTTSSTRLFIGYRIALGIFLLLLVSRGIVPDQPPETLSPPNVPAAHTR